MFIKLRFQRALSYIGQWKSRNCNLVSCRAIGRRIRFAFGLYSIALYFKHARRVLQQRVFATRDSARHRKFYLRFEPSGATACRFSSDDCRGRSGKYRDLRGHWKAFINFDSKIVDRIFSITDEWSVFRSTSCPSLRRNWRFSARMFCLGRRLISWISTCDWNDGTTSCRWKLDDRSAIMRVRSASIRFVDKLHAMFWSSLTQRFVTERIVNSRGMLTNWIADTVDHFRTNSVSIFDGCGLGLMPRLMAPVIHQVRLVSCQRIDHRMYGPRRHSIRPNDFKLAATRARQICVWIK